MRLLRAVVFGRTRVRPYIAAYGSVEIGGVEDDGQRVGTHKAVSEGVEEGGIGLEMDEAIGTEHLAVKLQEAGRYEPLACLLHLRVGEGNPYF